MKFWLSTLLCFGLLSLGSCDDSLKFIKTHNHCKRDGKIIPPGASVTDPKDPCNECYCCPETSLIKCNKKPCDIEQPPPCGKDHHIVQDTEHTCCMVCSDECPPPIAPLCSKDRVYYLDDDCAGRCGCSLRGGVVEQGPVTDTVLSHPCEECTCYEDGTVTCDNPVECPHPRLRCVNPKIDVVGGNCQWMCSEYENCMHSNGMILQPDGYVLIDDQICYCGHGPMWSPSAYCGKKDAFSDIEEWLVNDRCMKRPAEYQVWNAEMTP